MKIERHGVIEGHMSAESYTEGNMSATVVASGTTIYFSGIVALGPEHEVIAPDDFSGQVAFILETIERGLARHGADWSNLVSMVVYTTDEEAYMESFGLFMEKFEGNPPTITSIGTPHLSVPGLLLEIIPIAVI